MVFAPWCFAMEMRFSSKAATKNHSIVTFLSCWNHCARALPARCVLDGEMVIVKNDGLDFDALQLRLHPAASRVKLLSGQIPASFVFFDLLCLGDRDLRGEAFQKRRTRTGIAVMLRLNRRFISHLQPAIGVLPPIGFAALKAQAWMV